MQRANLEEPTRREPVEKISAEAPPRDPARIAARLLDIARARPLATFAAVLVASYMLGRVLRR